MYGNQNPVVYGDFDGVLAIAVSAGAAALVEAIPYVVAGVAGSAIGAYLAKKSKSSGKEKANDIPSWAKGEKPKFDFLTFQPEGASALSHMRNTANGYSNYLRAYKCRISNHRIGHHSSLQQQADYVPIGAVREKDGQAQQRH